MHLSHYLFCIFCLRIEDIVSELPFITEVILNAMGHCNTVSQAIIVRLVPVTVINVNVQLIVVLLPKYTLSDIKMRWYRHIDSN